MKLPESGDVEVGDMKPEVDLDLNLNLFWDLSHNSDTKRLAAAQKLVDVINLKQEATTDGICEELKYAITRLISGLGSSRKSARLGFVTALTILLQSTSSYDAASVLNLMDKKLKLKTDGGKKKENKDIFFGRVFCLLSLIESRKLTTDDDSLSKTVEQLVKLSNTKSYLKPVALHGICQLIEQVSSKMFESFMWPSLAPCFVSGWAGASPDTVETLILCSKRYPELCGKEFLKQYSWIPNKSKSKEIIALHSFKHVAKLLAESTICHPAVSSFALDIISIVGKKSKLGKFWADNLTSTLLSSSPERKYLAFKLAVHSLSYASVDDIPLIWSKELLKSLYHALIDKENPLHLVCKGQLISDLSQQLSNEKITSELQCALLFQMMNSPAGIHLDSVTHVGMLNCVVSRLKIDAVSRYIEWLKALFNTGKADGIDIKQLNMELARRWSSSQLAHLVRMASLPRNEKWILSIVCFIFFHAHFHLNTPTSSYIIDDCEFVQSDDFVEISDATVAHLRQCYTNLVSWLSSLPPLPVDHITNDQKQASRMQGVMSDGNFWLHAVIRFAGSLITSSDDVTCRIVMDATAQGTWDECVELIGQMTAIRLEQKSNSSEARALELLLLHTSIQIFSTDPEAVGSAHDILSELQSIVKERFGEDGDEDEVDVDQPHWVEVIVEILLSMLSNGSHGVRNIVEQVFRLVAPHLTRSALNLILNVLTMSDGDLTKDDQEDQSDEEDANQDMNGEHQVNGHSESESESSGDDADDDDDDDTMVDDEFKSKVKAALGNAAEASSDDESEAEDGESSDEEEFDDDAMMRIDHVLADIFKQRKKSKTAEKKITKLQVTHFQLRCLDLLEHFITRQNCPLVFDLVLPLLDVVESASRDPDKGVLAERASVVLRVKLCRMKTYPRNLTPEDLELLHDRVASALTQCASERAMFICRMASQCAMLFLRVLAGQSDQQQTGLIDVPRVCQVYADALDRFMQQRDSRLQVCVFEDLVQRQPLVAVGMSDKLLLYARDAVQVYRKTQSCQLLNSLIALTNKNDANRIDTSYVVTSLVDILSVQLQENPAAEIKPKYHSQLLKLLFTAAQSSKSRDKDFASCVESSSKVLHEFIKLEQVQRSQELTNLAWKVLSLLGEQREKSDKNEKREKKAKRKRNRKRKNSISSQTTGNNENGDAKLDESVNSCNDGADVVISKRKQKAEKFKEKKIKSGVKELNKKKKKRKRKDSCGES